MHDRLRALRRAISWHRRTLAAACAALAVLATIAAVRPAGPPTTEVLVVSEGLPSGATLSKSNTRMVALPRDTVPDRVVGREALGEQLAAPVTRGSPVTTVQLVKGIEARPGHVIAPVSLADESVVQVLHVGQVVDVHAVDQMGGRLVASEARVAALPGPDEGGMLSNNSRQPVLLEVRASEAAQVLTSSSGVMVILR